MDAHACCCCACCCCACFACLLACLLALLACLLVKVPDTSCSFVCLFYVVVLLTRYFIVYSILVFFTCLFVLNFLFFFFSITLLVFVFFFLSTRLRVFPRHKKRSFLLFFQLCFSAALFVSSGDRERGVRNSTRQKEGRQEGGGGTSSKDSYCFWCFFVYFCALIDFHHAPVAFYCRYRWPCSINVNALGHPGGVVHGVSTKKRGIVKRGGGVWD